MKFISLLVFTFLVLMTACGHRPAAPDEELGSEKFETPEAEGPQKNKLFPSFSFDWPLDQPVVINYFGWRKQKRRRNERMHEGVDLRARTGTPIYAAADGKVIYAGRKLRGYGRMVALGHDDDWSTVYAHLSKIDVKLKETVKKGDLIGYSGNTGRSRGPHLHFEIRKGADPLDPLLFLPQNNARN